MVFLKSMTSIPIKFIVILTATAGLTLAVAVSYLISRKDEDVHDEAPVRVKTSRNVTIEVKVPRDSIGIVIGRGGSTIKSVQAKSDTKINFKSEAENEEYGICVIRGTAETAQLAESIILEIIKNQPLIETVEVTVPLSAVGFIIGKGGESIQAISSMSHAKISVASTPRSDGSTLRKVTIKGTPEQIDHAKTLIAEKILEAEQKQKIQLSATSGMSGRKPMQLALSDVASEEQPLNSCFRYEQLVSTNSDGFMQVYVSAVHSPSLFWIQMISRKSVELDRLVEAMTDYYSVSENKSAEAFSLEQMPEVGTKVAATFKNDNKWYRADIVEVIKNEYNPEENIFDLYYVDYGDSAQVKISEICRLKSDYLKLPFQAIQCSLDNVRPRGSDFWTDEAIDCFENLVHVAEWKPLMARVVSFKESDSSNLGRPPVTCVELIDTNEAEDIVISKELVGRGFAVPVKTDSDDEINLTLPVNNLSNGNASSLETNNFNKSNEKSIYDDASCIPAGMEDSFDEDDFDGWMG